MLETRAPELDHGDLGGTRHWGALWEELLWSEFCWETFGPAVHGNHIPDGSGTTCDKKIGSGI